MKKFTSNDVFVLLGLVLTGTGLSFWFSFPISATVIGAVLLLIGLFGKRI